VHRDLDAFGPDADAFDQSDGLGQGKTTRRWKGIYLLYRYLPPQVSRRLKLTYICLQFGASSRTCVGKNISLLEMTKVIPELYRRFDFELEDDDWETDDVFFVKTSFNCKVILRSL
jgi:Cytochrome P450